jgi:hypothetical protein
MCVICSMVDFGCFTTLCQLLSCIESSEVWYDEQAYERQMRRDVKTSESCV